MADANSDMRLWLPAARAGSREALGQVLEACRAYLLLVAEQGVDRALIAKGGASDLVQQTFLEAQREFARFQGDTESELLAWLRCMLRNNITDFTRRYRRAGKREVEREVALDKGDSAPGWVTNLAADTASPSQRLIAQEQAEAVQRALERLPGDYRRVILLHHEEACSFEEIGPLMERSADAARKLWARAIERLQQELETMS